MENLILWGVPVLGLLMGLGSRFYRSYLLFCHILFAAYLSIGLEGVVSSFYSLPGGADIYRPAITMAALLLVGVILFVKITEQLSNGKQEYEFGVIDKIGGGICGFAAAAIVINFAAFLICTTPHKSALAGFASVQALERGSITGLLRVTGTIDTLSFQSMKPGERVLRLEELARRGDPPEPEPAEPAPAEGAKK